MVGGALNVRAPLWGAGGNMGGPSDTGAGKNTGERGCSGRGERGKGRQRREKWRQQLLLRPLLPPPSINTTFIITTAAANRGSSS